MNKPATEEIIRRQIAENAVLIYMKGTPDAPECGFSAKAIAALKAANADLAFVNVLQMPPIRERLPSISGWPTFPQLFINGELVGGSDIICEMAESGELQPLLDQASAAA